MHGPHPPGASHPFDPVRCRWDAQHAQQQAAIQSMLAQQAQAQAQAARAADGAAIGPTAPPGADAARRLLLLGA